MFRFKYVLAIVLYKIEGFINYLEDCYHIDVSVVCALIALCYLSLCVFSWLQVCLIVGCLGS